jgi:hypothetical protein
MKIISGQGVPLHQEHIFVMIGFLHGGYLEATLESGQEQYHQYKKC